MKFVNTILAIMLLFQLIGGFMCGVGLWARVEYTQQNESIGLFSGWDMDPAIIFIFVGVIMFLLGFCGCVGALRENICLLKFVSDPIKHLLSLRTSCTDEFQKIAHITPFFFIQKINFFRHPLFSSQYACQSFSSSNYVLEYLALYSGKRFVLQLIMHQIALVKANYFRKCYCSLYQLPYLIIKIWNLRCA